jgi:hypothetical protein
LSNLKKGMSIVEVDASFHLSLILENL